ncbi:uncharacterized protein LOC110453821 [Mizuhopecten yessoensis]|uniref:uncharacterized protein LOC110453821 n=1 Tax=Mizuhopecten yessoensis TaxID=6573 RepID=UPI000B45CC70|nr:uncharacterized protein LOC110453821 [Mizuhopecten yessoensis]
MPKRKATKDAGQGPQAGTRGANRRQASVPPTEEEAEPYVEAVDAIPMEPHQQVDHMGGSSIGISPIEGSEQLFPPSNPLPITCAHTSLGANVSPGNRQIIISGQYIDLGLLLLNGPSEQGEQLLMLNKKGKLITKAKINERIVSVEKWTDAMMVFATIYGSAHPAKHPDLLRYISTVRLGPARSPGGWGWKRYDEQFRLRQALDPDSSWAAVDMELWLLCMTGQTASTRPSAPATSSQQGRLMCFDFNYKGSCFKSPCSYVHACTQCGGNHSANVCNAAGGGGGGAGQKHFQPKFNQTGSGQHNFKPRFSQPRSPYPRAAVTNQPGHNQGYNQQAFRGRGRGNRFMGPGSNTY